MRDNASVSREPSITFFETDLLLLDPEILFLSVNPKLLFRIRSVTIILFLSVNPKSLFRIRSVTLVLFLSVNPMSLFRIRSVSYLVPKSLFRIRSVSLSCFWAWISSRYLESDLYLLSSSAHISSNFVINTRFSLVIRSTWVSEKYSYSWYCLAVATLH
jgi:hypothetical protein